MSFMQVVPTRTVRSSKPKKATAKSASAAVAADEQEATPSAFDPDELLPRADISAQLGSKVMASLGSSNWKERNHTMDDIENIIKAANRIQPSVGDLVPGLKVCRLFLKLDLKAGSTDIHLTLRVHSPEVSNDGFDAWVADQKQATTTGTSEASLNRLMSAGKALPLSQARLTDSNKNLVARALIIFGELAKAMGPAWERVGRPVLQQAVTFLADNKKQVTDLRHLSERK